MTTRMSARTNPLLDLSLSEASRLVMKKEISPVELVDAALDRIKSVDSTLHAYITVYEQAREVAKAAEIMIAAGHELGPLHGIPLAATPARGAFFHPAGLHAG